METVRFIITALLMITGIFMLTVSLIGNFRFSFILNRMQVGALTDTIGAVLIIAGIIVGNGLNILTIKLMLVVLFLWFANPVSSHFLAKTEIIANDDITDEVEVVYNDDI